MTPNNSTKIDSEHIANAQRHICPACGRDTWDKSTLPCKECPCRNCGGDVDRSEVLHKKDCCSECKKAFEKAERTEALRMYREARMAATA